MLVGQAEVRSHRAWNTEKSLDFLQRTIGKPLKHIKQWHNLILRAFLKDLLCGGYFFGEQEWHQGEQL